MLERPGLMSILIIAACARPPAPIGVTPPRSPPALAVPSLPTAPVSSVSLLAQPFAARPAFKDQTIACGNNLCRVPDQVCCSNTDEATCAPRVSKTDAIDDLGPQADVCPGRELAFCDDSSDCAKDQRCCLDFIASNVSVTHCSAAVCDEHELCVAERPCRTPSTACIGGQCRRTDVHLSCGEHICSGSTPLC
jgi:hypothetical protein